MSQSKSWRQLITRLRNAGLEVEQRKNGHYRVSSKTGRSITVAWSPRSPERAQRKVLADCRRYLGVEVE